jgi:hypothetical protein
VFFCFAGNNYQTSRATDQIVNKSLKCFSLTPFQVNGGGFGFAVRSRGCALTRTNRFRANVTNVGIVGNSAGRGASDSDFVLRAREKVLADALGIGALIKGLPTWKKNKYSKYYKLLFDVEKLAIRFG